MTEASEPKPVIVRTYSAGVHFGYLARREGKEVDLTKSRRIHYWNGANSCSPPRVSIPSAAASPIPFRSR